jgi:hypothetical protein
MKSHELSSFGAGRPSEHTIQIAPWKEFLPVIDGGVKLELLGALDTFEADDHVGDDLAIATSLTLCLFWRQLRHFPFVHLLVFLYPQPCTHQLHLSYCILPGKPVRIIDRVP